MMARRQRAYLTEWGGKGEAPPGKSINFVMLMLMNNDNEFGDRLQLEDEQQEDSHAFHFNHHLDHVRRWRAKIESFIIDGGWQQICISFLIATVGHWVRKLIATWTNDEEERREFICRLTKYQNISLD